MYGNPEAPARYTPTRQNDIQILEDYKRESSCATFSKFAIFGFNILFLLVGTATLALGVWLRVDSRFRDFLSERYRQAVDEAFWQAPTFYAFSYILMCPRRRHDRGRHDRRSEVPRLFLGLYGFSVLVLLMATLSAGIYILYKKDGIDVELSDALNYMVQHYSRERASCKRAWIGLQQAFRCCGNAGCSDFRMFRQDPPSGVSAYMVCNKPDERYLYDSRYPMDRRRFRYGRSMPPVDSYHDVGVYDTHTKPSRSRSVPYTISKYAR
ncbi:Tetraspanin family protein [Aphelenchoides fujianensis]|nr:Tetraspanin family protein [Aphelenchoides fujianensis]